MSDISITWEKLPGNFPGQEDMLIRVRAPTLEEIKKVYQYPDRRVGPPIYPVVCSRIPMQEVYHSDRDIGFCKIERFNKILGSIPGLMLLLD